MSLGTWVMPMTWSPRRAPSLAFNAKPHYFVFCRFDMEISVTKLRRAVFGGPRLSTYVNLRKYQAAFAVSGLLERAARDSGSPDTLASNVGSG